MTNRILLWLVSIIHYATTSVGRLVGGLYHVRCWGLARTFASLLWMQVLQSYAETIVSQPRRAATTTQRKALQPLGLNAKLRQKN